MKELDQKKKESKRIRNKVCWRREDEDFRGEGIIKKS